MLTQRLLLSLAVALSIGGVSLGATDQLGSWVQNGRCLAFNANASAKAPFARNDSESIQWKNGLDAFLHQEKTTYVYDPKAGIALRLRDQGAVGDILMRAVGPPPVHVLQSDLSRLATTSGIRLGSSASTVVQKLGKPYIVHGCGLQRYAYLVNREVGGNTLDFTIKDGHVVEIFQTYGD